LPLILAGMGYDSEDVLLLNAPPYAAAAISAFTLSCFSDKYNLRFPVITTQALLCIIGLSMTAFASSNVTRYAGTFLGMMGCQGNIPAILAYSSNNILSQSKRAFTSALVVGFGGIGGIVATTTFREQDAPFYRPGLWVSIGFQLMILGLLATSTIVFRLRNAKGGIIEGREGFKYTL